MKFRTTFQLPQSTFKINHQHKILTIGSCFSDEMGNRLVELKFDGLINPYGIIFNAYSIQNLIERSIQKRYFTIDDVHQNGEQFFCFDVHSSFNALSSEEILLNLNSTVDRVHNQIHNCDVFMITLGTSWVYERNDTSEIVANCHKIDAKQFKKVLLTTEENFKSLDLIAFQVTKINPNIKIITTVSPVRHIKDGMVENNVSKARLIDALYQLDLKYEQVEYFPSYELVLDDLRDYRFYKEDLIHPTNQAIEYIWEKFGEKYFDESTQTIIQKINKIKNALNHRPFYEESESHQKFLSKTLQMINELDKGNSIDFEQEKQYLSTKIKSC
ncbi:GSCFA domain-containing protein [Faecalibacter bovis]|uniref:GSCFA domain-containing protein n=1 Tax=Faecalibacter bovis TaxID=2898187 RepID=A0ABX7XBH6_9FLAO|nr:GSCFA domain-containing protein [Faecalibacter bovis]QTV05225.1 GSCFA domain-containing protein [Faecalibacter bovis]